jgi:uncharacterized protein HemX
MEMLFFNLKFAYNLGYNNEFWTSFKRGIMFKKIILVILVFIIAYSTVSTVRSLSDKEGSSVERIENKSETEKQKKKGGIIKPILMASTIMAGFAVVLVATVLVLAAGESHEKLIEEYQQEQHNLLQAMNERSKRTEEKIDAEVKQFHEETAKREAERKERMKNFDKLSSQEKLDFSNQFISAYKS